MDKKEFYKLIAEDVKKIVKKHINEATGQVTWEITIKEVDKKEPFKTTHIGNLTKKEVVDFFGLEEPDVEWYKVEQVD